MRYRSSITAHSGCEGTLRDSRESLEIALQLKADAVEVDVRQAPDGTLVISHDRQSTYHNVLTLEEVIAQVAANGTILLNCDLKEAQAAQDVLHMAGRLGLSAEKLILSGSLSPSALRADPVISRHCSIYLNIEELLGELVGVTPQENGLSLWVQLQDKIQDISSYLQPVSGICRELKVGALNLPYFALTEPCFKLVDEIPLSVWTVNEESMMQHMFRLGVKNLTTLNVRLAMKQRESLRGEPVVQ